MTREQIEKAAKEAVQNHFQCNGKYPCEERDYCEFCNGHNSAFDCKEDCGADDFNEGFFVGAQWRINSVWHNMNEKPNGMFVILADFGQEEYSLGINLEGMESAKRWAYVSDLLPEKKEGWVNVYKERIYSTKEEAIEATYDGVTWEE